MDLTKLYSQRSCTLCLYSCQITHKNVPILLWQHQQNKAKAITNNQQRMWQTLDILFIFRVVIIVYKQHIKAKKCTKFLGN